MSNWRKLLPSLPDYPDNPLFRYEIRQVRWAETQERLMGYSLIVFGLTLVIAGVVWLVLVIRNPPFAYRYSDRFLDRAWSCLFHLPSSALS